MSPEDLELLKKFVSTNQPFNFRGVDIHSSLVVCLGQARMLTRRDQNGNSTSPDGSWPGAIMYLILLEIIGQNFIPKQILNESKFKKSDYNIDNALQYSLSFFGPKDLSQKELISIKCLRNCFAHNFNLIHKPKGKKQDQSRVHRFTVSASDQTFLVKLPATPWDGDTENKLFLENTETSVNLHQIGNRAEIIYKELCTLIENNEIELFGERTINELIYGFSFRTFNQN